MKTCKMIRPALLCCLFWSGVLVASASSASEPGKVRLFILSGQSNMSKLNPDISFTPTVKKAFPGDQIIVIKDASGGQPIRQWYKNWHSGSTPTPAAEAGTKSHQAADAGQNRQKHPAETAANGASV